MTMECITCCLLEVDDDFQMEVSHTIMLFARVKHEIFGFYVFEIQFI